MSDSEESSVVDSSSASESQTSGRDQQSRISEESIARSETRRVTRSKYLVAFVIFVAAAAVGTATFFFTQTEENDDFESEYNDFAREVVDLTHHEAFNVFGAIESMSTTITSYALASSVQWPNLTMPHFEIRGENNNRLSKALQVTFAPLVKNKQEWEQYAKENQEWIKEGLVHAGAPEEDITNVRGIADFVWRLDQSSQGSAVVQSTNGVDFGPGSFAPVWQQSPAPHDTSIINFDLLSHPTFQRVYHGMWETAKPVLSEVTDLAFLYEGAVHEEEDGTNPHSFLLSPVYDSFEGTRTRDNIIGFLVAVLPWDSYFSNLLPNSVKGMDVVLHNTCGNHFTYRINGPNAVFVGEGDLHEKAYDYLEVDTPFSPFLEHEFSENNEHCEYDLRIFPSAKLHAEYTTTKPAIYTIVVIAVFFFTAMVFALYDHFVNVRQKKVMATAKRTNAIVSSLFPQNVRERILKDAEEQATEDMKGKTIFGFNAPAKTQLKNFLDVEDGTANPHGSKPIADLFPDATVMFADVVGFTAWSSVREPCQVFTLLETVYAAFDEIAQRRRVFKVETIGDCYVAVCGLPDPRKDHAVVMARFARDVLTRMNDLTKRLEVTLGPDTGDLSLRIGLHSGPVTAGVLRGDKSRFQLFGDTVNTAARIESAGSRNRIHLSTETAQLISSAGKPHWVVLREEVVNAKGKGELQTYWLETKLPSGPSCRSGSTRSDEVSEGTMEANEKKWASAGLKPAQEKFEEAQSTMDPKTKRLVEWNSDVLARLLRHIIARRNAHLRPDTDTAKPSGAIVLYTKPGQMVLDEVMEIIHLPEFDPEAAKNQEDPDSIEIDSVALGQLREYVTMIASMYRKNPFHNFEHASHVTMSVTKLLSRIVAPDLQKVSESSDGVASTLHDHTYGITSDPLTQFACVFAALIHDVDHTGVPNAQLVKEKAPIASVYKGKSVAEQNSVDIAWTLLMDERFVALRGLIYSDENEMRHFRELVVNSVMATDIVDKELKALRNKRWDTAFSQEQEHKDLRDNVNRKATIVIEHLIQASDIAHTMQHWHIYRKWNERLFHEMYDAYRKGRADKDPSEFWYKGEIGFFDFYIIPLAKKLNSCGVFGVSSDEYLNYAQKNRSEWESKGQDVIASMIEKYKSTYTTPEIRLDDIQEHEKDPSRSRIFRNDTLSDDRLVGLVKKAEKN